jgi:hypothetical protein
MSEEQKIPSKEEIIAFLKEQIEVKTFQYQLQELNTKLAVAKAEELKALSVIGNITNPSTGNAPTQQPQGRPYKITQEDMDANPELASEGIQVGDEVLIPTEEQLAAAEAQPEEETIKSKKLKK